MTTMVVAAHPDDEVLGCGGTIARKTRAGEDVVIAILGEGWTSRSPRREEARSDLVATLATQARVAGRRLGASRVYGFGLPDNRFDEVSLLDIVKLIEKLADEVQPTEVLTHHGGDLNLDHAIAFRATMIAFRPLPGSRLRALMSYEVPSSTEWAFQRHGASFSPNFFVDISETLSIKLAALEDYTSEVRSFPHPRSPEALTASARRWGACVGREAAEAFELIWRVE